MEVDGLSVHDFGEHVVGIVGAGQVGRVTQEFNAVCRSGESDKGVARRQQPRIAVKKDSDRLAEGDALAGADGHCWVAQVVNGVAGGNAVDKVVLTGRAGGGHSDCV